MNKLLMLSMAMLVSMSSAETVVNPANLPGEWSCKVDRTIQGMKVSISENINVTEDRTFTAKGESKIAIPAAQQQAGLPSEIFINYTASGSFDIDGNTLISNIKKTKIVDTNHPSKAVLAEIFEKPDRVETSTITVLNEKELKHQFEGAEVTYDCKKQD